MKGMMQVPGWFATRLGMSVYCSDDYRLGMSVSQHSVRMSFREHPDVFINAGSTIYQAALQQMVDLDGGDKFGKLMGRLAELGQEKAADIAEWTLAQVRYEASIEGTGAKQWKEMGLACEDLMIGHLSPDPQQAQAVLRHRGRSLLGGPLQPTEPCQLMEPGFASSGQIEASFNNAPSVNSSSCEVQVDTDQQKSETWTVMSQ